MLVFVFKKYRKFWSVSLLKHFIKHKPLISEECVSKEYVCCCTDVNNPIFQPHNHSKKVAKFYYATPELVQKSIDTSLEAKKEWEKIPMDDRLKLFLNVADLMATTYRADLNATTMLGQAKTVIQVCMKLLFPVWIFFHQTQQARKFKKVRAKKLVKFPVQNFK